MSELLINKIPTDENMVTIDDDLILDKKHFLSVSLNKKDKSAFFCFSTDLALFYFAKNLLYHALDKDFVPFLEFIPNLNNDIVNGVRLASKSCKFLIDIEDSSQILNIQNQYTEIDKSLFKEKVNIFFKNNYEENFVFLSFSDKAKLLNFANFLLSLAKYGTIKKYEMIDKENNKMTILVG